MKQSIHIGLGTEFSDIFQNISEHILANGGKFFLPYFKPLVIHHLENSKLKIETFNISQIDPIDQLTADMKKNFVSRESIEKQNNKNKDVLIIDLFSSLYDQMINIGTVDNLTELKVCLYIPLWRPELVEDAIELAKLLSNSENAYSFDFVGLTHDLTGIFTKDPLVNFQENQEKGHLKAKVNISINRIINELKPNDAKLKNLIIVQNKQVDGISLNLNSTTFISIISEFIQLYIENYPEILQNFYINGCKITGIGISEIYLNQAYFANYLISKAYVSILEKEKINETIADVNKLAIDINGVLSNRFGNQINLFSKFWKESIEEKLNLGRNSQAILQDIRPELDRFFQDLGNELQNFIYLDKYSLPEKRAALASLLGEDDELFDGQIYDKSTPIIDDCAFEVADLFVQMNNHLVKNPEYDLTSYATLQSEADENGNVRIPLKEIKHLKNQIRDSTQTIRNLEGNMAKMADAIAKDEIAEKVLIDGDFFHIGNEKYRIIEKPIEEQLLEDTYQRLSKIPGEVDLREHFSQIKNQGEIAACSAFATVGVFEYMSKLKGLTSIYSESFVYFMARSLDDKTENDEGTSLFNAIKALYEFGVCKKEDWDKLDEFALEPDLKAKENALNNRILKALNVNHNLDDIKSAISEGYPVCFGLRIYESFGKSIKGFIVPPTDEELKGQKNGYHSMVICAYSDSSKLFIVRNSWSKTFGDLGYCYISYSYIEDKQHFIQGYIIKEISVGSVFQFQPKMKVNFDTTDKLIEYAITRNLCNEENIELHRNKLSYEFNRRRYFNIVTKLNSINIRNQLVDGEEQFLRKEKDFAEKEVLQIKEDQSNDLKKIQTYTTKITYWGIAIIAFIIAAIILSFTYLDLWDVIISEYLWLGVASIVLIALLIPIWIGIRNRVYRHAIMRWDEIVDKVNLRIFKIKEDMDLLRFKANIAGLLHKKIFDLRHELVEKHKIMKSYVGNLVEWHKSESQATDNLSPEMNPPFINIIENKMLDTFFSNHVDDIIADIKLSSFINSYELTEKGIRHFKTDLRQTIMTRLFQYVDSFNMYDYLSNSIEYDYLTTNIEITRNSLDLLRKMSKIYLQPKSYVINKDALFIMAVNKSLNANPSIWVQAIRQIFSVPPIEIGINAKNKIVMIQILELDASDLKFMN